MASPSRSEQLDGAAPVCAPASISGVAPNSGARMPDMCPAHHSANPASLPPPPPPAEARTLYIFDHDMTLVNVVTPQAWEEEFGIPWPGHAAGFRWYSHEDSLFKHARGPAMDAYHEALRDPAGIIMLHTGRRPVLQHKALQVLAECYGATRFDELGFTTGPGRSLKKKVARIKALLQDKYPGVTKVVLYDDKACNVARFRSMQGEEGFGSIEVIVHDVGVKPSGQ